mgnify:CR=1 FL=1
MMAVVHMRARLTVWLVSPSLGILYPFFQIQANAPNAKRIADMGFSNGLFNQIMTSGEALWHDIDQGKIAQSKFLRLKERKVMHWVIT